MDVHTVLKAISPYFSRFFFTPSIHFFHVLQDVMSMHPEKAGNPMPFPIIADHNRELSVQLGMLDPDERDKDGMPLTARCVSA